MGVTHALTVDVEGFAESHAQSVDVDSALLTPSVSDREIEANLNTTLELFARYSVSATFFFLGRIAQTSPHLVRLVAEAGHEIGSHSLNHLRITGQTRREFAADLKIARAGLQDASGQPVLGFRAPDFSIGAGNTWAFDELMEAGFGYDSSVVPTTIHDVYGMADIPHDIFKWPNGLVEVPLPVMSVLGKSVPSGGGGYFRLFPLRVTLSTFRRSEREGRESVFYIHPYEIGVEAPTLTGLSFSRRFRHYVRLKQGQRRLGWLLERIRFGRMDELLYRTGHLARPSAKTEDH